MIDNTLDDSDDFLFLMFYLESLEYEAAKKEFILLKKSIELMEKENQGLDRAIEKKQTFIDSKGIERKVESKNGIEESVETKIFKAVITGVLSATGELFYSMKRYYDKKGNKITIFSDKNLSFRYLNDTLILVNVWFDENMGVSIHDGGLFLNEIKDIFEDMVNMDEWNICYLRLTEDSVRFSIEKKYTILNEFNDPINLIIIIDKNKNDKFIKMECGFMSDSENCSQTTLVKKLLNSIEQPFTIESIDELSNLLDLNYKY